MGTDKTKTEIKFKVHIVNSVKGGSGKSTFSLLLADHFVRNGEDAYVIDLDLCGTSWYSDFRCCWDKPEPQCIQNLMYSPCDGGFAPDVWTKLNVTSKAESVQDDDRQINVCISAKDQNERLCDMPDAELLEHVVFHLIQDVLKRPPREEIPGLSDTFEVLLEAYRETNVIHNMQQLIQTKRRATQRTFWGQARKLFEDREKEILDIADPLRAECIKGFKENFFDLSKYEADVNKLKKELQKTLEPLNQLIGLYPERPRNLKEQELKELKNLFALAASDFDKYTYEDDIKKLEEKYHGILEDTGVPIADDSNIVKRMKTCEKYIEIIDSPVIHFVLDLPPSHDAAAEQICHRLFFDNNSLLNRDKEYGGKYHINLYMMTPVDQISAWKKNKAYVHNLIYGQRKYSSTIRSFLEAPDQRMKICFVIIDNHGWRNLMPSSRKIESDMSTLKSSLKSDIQSNKIDKIFETFNYVYLPFVDFEFKRKINIFDEKEDAIPLDFGKYRGGDIDSIVKDLA